MSTSRPRTSKRCKLPTSFLFEEAKHTDFFARMLDEVVGERADLKRVERLEKARGATLEEVYRVTEMVVGAADG